VLEPFTAVLIAVNRRYKSRAGVLLTHVDPTGGGSGSGRRVLTLTERSRRRRTHVHGHAALRHCAQLRGATFPT